MKKKSYIVYLLVFCFILMIPSLGMLISPNEDKIENRELVELPYLQDEDGFNFDILGKLGEYFNDHFAFRGYLVTWNSLIQSKIFKNSPTQNVVLGNDDWLYYAGTLDDYQGMNVLSSRELKAIEHNLQLMQDYVEENGATFVFTIAPNKNSVYGQNMPYYYVDGNTSNIELLDLNNIHYVDVYDLFEQTKEILYFHRDSHWNNKGAMLVYNRILDSIGKKHETYKNVPYDKEIIHEGDLDSMLYPKKTTLEEEYVYKNKKEFHYVNDVKDNMDDWIETKNEKKDDTLLMYRDSFGESLLPFFAEEFNHAYFSRYTPYNLSQIKILHPDVVILERVERRLSGFIEDAAIMEPKTVENLTGLEIETNSSMEVKQEGTFVNIKGEVDPEYIEEDSEIFISIRDLNTKETKTYPVFVLQSENGDANGFQVYLENMSTLFENKYINVFVKNKENCKIVLSRKF